MQKNLRVPSSDLGKKVRVRNLMFRFADTPNPNLRLGSGSMIWMNRTSNIRFGFGFEPGSKGSEPDRGQSSTVPSELKTIEHTDGIRYHRSR
jgi:hypothetical protein